MPATAAVTSEFTWDARAMRYRRRGQFVSERAVKLGVRRVIRESRAEMAAVTDEMIAGKIGVGDWRARFASELKNLHVAGAMAGQGGPANMTRGDYLRVGRALKKEYRYLDNFAGQIKAGEVSNARIRQRAAMYAGGMNSAYEGGRVASATLAGMTQARNVLSEPKEHCTTGHGRVGCRELTDRGWMPIGDMPLPGSRRCLRGCGCSLKFRKPNPGDNLRSIFGDRFKVAGDPNARTTRIAIADLSEIPDAVLRKLAAAGVGIEIGQTGVAGFPGMAYLAGQRPRGWQSGTWDDVAGGYDYRTKRVLIGTGTENVASLALHETGHAIDDVYGLSGRPELAAIHAAEFDRLTPYLQQGGPGDPVGREELVAEGYAAMVKYGREYAGRVYGRAFVAFIDDALE